MPPSHGLRDVCRAGSESQKPDGEVLTRYFLVSVEDDEGEDEDGDDEEESPPDDAGFSDFVVEAAFESSPPDFGFGPAPLPFA
jgi:hypothetical protein